MENGFCRNMCQQGWEKDLHLSFTLIIWFLKVYFLFASFISEPKFNLIFLPLPPPSSSFHNFSLIFILSLDAPLVTNRKFGCAKEVPFWILWNATRWQRKKLATNEVLSEINNAVCTVLKECSEGGVFLYGPQWRCGWGGWWLGVLGARRPLPGSLYKQNQLDELAAR